MPDIIGHPHIGDPNIADIAWMVPAFIVVLITVGVVASLLAGLVTPDVIGADGLSGSMMTAP